MTTSCLHPLKERMRLALKDRLRQSNPVSPMQTRLQRRQYTLVVRFANRTPFEFMSRSPPTFATRWLAGAALRNLEFIRIARLHKTLGDSLRVRHVFRNNRMRTPTQKHQQQHPQVHIQPASWVRNNRSTSVRPIEFILNRKRPTRKPKSPHSAPAPGHHGPKRISVQTPAIRTCKPSGRHSRPRPGPDIGRRPESRRTRR